LSRPDQFPKSISPENGEAANTVKPTTEQPIFFWQLSQRFLTPPGASPKPNAFRLIKVGIDDIRRPSNYEKIVAAEVVLSKVLEPAPNLRLDCSDARGECGSLDE